MNWFVYHVASGQIFFTGVILIVISAIADSTTTLSAKPLTAMSLLTGGIAIAISSTPIPYWYYGIAVILTTVWLVARYVHRFGRWTRLAVIVVWAIAAALELPYHIVPSLAEASSRSLTILGDSVTAGMGSSDKSIRWPTLLTLEHGLTIQDLSHPGETVASATKSAKSEPVESAVVILEIGGNDLLGKTTSDQFSEDLDALLAQVCVPGRQVIMLELPLPPFRNEYGRIQRSLAHKYDITLIPKNIFLSVLAAEGSTIDTIHLTSEGHERMAESVWEIVKSAFPETEVH